MFDRHTHQSYWKRLGLAVVTGLLLAAAQPLVGLSVLGWLAPGILLLLGIGLGGFGAFRVGYVAGLTCHLGSFYWLLYIPVPFASMLGWVALSAVLALYQGVWVWL